mmetsp:Transcript_18908/g.18912  ORF Transcript_18908/g.18912 Transcript_18908/m.18912 type:complete len:205 (-) Transcript_18908:39-653(-)
MNKSPCHNLYETVHKAALLTHTKLEQVIPPRSDSSTLDRKFYRNKYKLIIQKSSLPPHPLAERLDLLSRHKRAGSNLDFPKPILNLSHSSPKSDAKSLNPSPLKLSLCGSISSLSDYSSCSAHHSRNNSINLTAQSPKPARSSLLSLEEKELSSIVSSIDNLKVDNLSFKRQINESLFHANKVCSQACGARIRTRVKRSRLHTQ